MKFNFRKEFGIVPNPKGVLLSRTLVFRVPLFFLKEYINKVPSVVELTQGFDDYC